MDGERRGREEGRERRTEWARKAERERGRDAEREGCRGGRGEGIGGYSEFWRGEMGAYKGIMACAAAGKRWLMAATRTNGKGTKSMSGGMV